MQQLTHFEVTEIDGEPVLTVAVEIDGGMLSASMQLDGYEPGTTGAVVGYVAHSLAGNAGVFPGVERAEPAARERTVRVGRESVAVVEVRFVPDDAEA